MKIINVTYRLPVSILKTEQGTEVRQSSGGLATAVTSLFEKSSSENQKNVWLGCADFTTGEWLSVSKQLSDAYEIVPVFIPKSIHHDFYGGFSNSVLWPLFHYFPSYVTYKEKYFKAYQKANEIIAEKLLSIIEKNDVIWIHDYHLLPLAQLIKEQKRDVHIGFFLHIPFPSFELFNILPKYCREYLLKGMLGADLIGFHTHDYNYHFLNNLHLTLGLQHSLGNISYGGRVIKSKAFPIGIDFERFQKNALSESVIKEVETIKDIYKDKKIIFSVDRLDYTKGIIYRLRGFERFLEENPELAEKVVFLLVVVPSRAELPKYADRRNDIEQFVSYLNGRFGTYKWTPIVFQYRSLAFDELIALYKSCDCALITPLRDGMNLVSKEFIAANEGNGMLILSEMAGAAKELSDAIIINPLDKEDITSAITEAFNMDIAEKWSRMDNMRKQVKNQNVFKWANDFFESLLENNQITTFPLDTFIKFNIYQSFSKSKKRLILLDYDGTLTGFKENPENATPGTELKELLASLSNSSRVGIISGRKSSTLDTWFGNLDIDLIAEHGAACRIEKKWIDLMPGKAGWWEAVHAIMNDYTMFCSGSFIEEKKYSLAWHYRKVKDKAGERSAREMSFILNNILKNSGANVLVGNKVIEVKPIDINKGNAFLHHYSHQQFDFALAIGDDTTDEDMFSAVKRTFPEGVTIKVGEGESVARYRVENHLQTLAFLEGLKKPYPS